MFTQIAAIIFVALTGVIVIIGVQRADKGIMPHIRRIPALDAIDEAVGRSVELGRQTFFTIGGARMGGTWTGGTMSAISMLRYCANLAAEKGAKLWAGSSVVDQIPLIDDAMRTGFQEAGSPESYNYDTDVKWFPNQMAYIAGCAGIYAREPPASQILLGSYMAEALAMCEIGRRGGAFMIGGTDYRPYMPYMLAICDYALIGEEIFIASAYVSDDARLKNTVWVEDIIKFALIALTVIGVLANLAGIEAFGVFLGS